MILPALCFYVALYTGWGVICVNSVAHNQIECAYPGELAARLHTFACALPLRREQYQ